MLLCFCLIGYGGNQITDWIEQIAHCWMCVILMLFEWLLHAQVAACQHHHIFLIFHLVSEVCVVLIKFRSGLFGGDVFNKKKLF